jgi:hypothetical protein
MSAITKALNMESLFLFTHTHTPTVQLCVLYLPKSQEKQSGWVFGLFWNCVMLSPKGKKKVSINPRISWPGFWFVLKLCNVESK